MILLPLWFACGGAGPDRDATTPSSPTGPSDTGGPTGSGLAWTPDWEGVSGFVGVACFGCHREGGAAGSSPLPLALKEDLTRGAGRLVVPFDPSASVLWRVISGAPLPGDPEVMPPGSGPLPEREIDHVRQWILAGAPAPLLPLDDDRDGVTGIDGDCDDADPTIHPGAEERCDGVDQDCDGWIDEEAVDATDWFLDGDRDGAGAGTATRACAAPADHVDRHGDCDDGDPTRFAGAEETCTDAVDRNCDGSIGAVDRDGDGFVACLECDDGDPGVNPGAAETCDGVDQDCDGVADEDAVDAPLWWPDDDGDGFGDPSFAALAACEAPTGWVADDTDCDDGLASVNPAAPFDGADGRDDDCDGAVDEDGAPVSFLAAVQPILDLHCTGCHDAVSPSDGLDLTGDAYGVLVSVPSRDVAGMDLVTPGAPADSYLWHKVSGTHLTVGGAGGRMPKPPDPPLSAPELATLETWILGGALP